MDTYYTSFAERTKISFASKQSAEETACTVVAREESTMAIAATAVDSDSADYNFASSGANVIVDTPNYIRREGGSVHCGPMCDSENVGSRCSLHNGSEEDSTSRSGAM